MLDLTVEKALIFRITHISNVPWLLENGVHCPNSDIRDPNFRRIGNLDLIAKRVYRAVSRPPGGTLSDYVPFYFTPCSPMLYNIKTGYQGVEKLPMADIVVLVSSLHRIRELGIDFVFTDRHAYLMAAQYSSDLDDLNVLDWPRLSARDFKKKLDEPDKMERYQAEALIHRHLPVNGIVGLACYGEAQRESLRAIITQRGLAMPVAARPVWYP